MPDKYLLSGVIAATFVAQALSNRRLKKHRKILIQAYMTEMENNKFLMEKTEYLFRKFEEHDITLDEFDLIVLANDIPEE